MALAPGCRLRRNPERPESCHSTRFALLARFRRDGPLRSVPMFWPFSTLVSRQTLRVTSIDTRAKEVNDYKWPENKKELTIEPKTVAVLSTPYSPTIDLAVKPSVVLARLGQVTTPPVTAPMFRIASKWAWVRYCWAFADPSPNEPLRLSARAASAVHHHHRQVVSEELGIALTLEAAIRYLKDTNSTTELVEVVDVDEALAACEVAGLAVGQPTSTKMRPDYLLVQRVSSQPAKIWALECKGTHDQTVKVEVLHKAAAQVCGIVTGPLGTSVGSWGWDTPQGLIAAATLSSERICVEMLDPPSAERWRGEPAERTKRADREPIVEIAEDGSAAVLDEGRFIRVLEDLLESRLLSVAGRPVAAHTRMARWRAVSEDAGVSEKPDEFHDNVLGDFEGSLLRVPLAENAVRVFLGVERSIIAAVLADDDAARVRAGERWRERIANRHESEDDAFILGNNQEQRVTVAMPDGLLMDIRPALP